jgi:glycosyltransferase involved in cell wall biosynthesis
MSATFSAAVVARNEESLVERCLGSIAWCDERIVIDMDSVDRTRELAMPLATKIVTQEWIPHMEWARNRGIELATGDWILVAAAPTGHGFRRLWARRSAP